MSCAARRWASWDWGRIGLEVARRAKAFGMNLIGYDPFVAPVIARENGVTLVPIDEIFSGSDYLSLHVGLTPQTEGLINKHSIAIMKTGRANPELRARRADCG